MSLDKFLTELSYFNDSSTDIDAIMNGADIVDTSYHDIIFERLNTARTTLTKASIYFCLIPKELMKEMASSVLTRAYRLRKVSRGIFLWLLYSRNMDFNFMSMEGESFAMLTSGDLAETYRQLCMTLDMTSKLVSSSSLELVQHGHDKILFLLDITEELMDLISLMGYEGSAHKYLQDSLSEIIETVEVLDRKSKVRLNIE